MNDLTAALSALAARGVTSLPPLAFVLGSGLGPLADEVEDAESVFAELEAELDGSSDAREA